MGNDNSSVQSSVTDRGGVRTRPQRSGTGQISYESRCYCVGRCDSTCLNRGMSQWCSPATCALSAQACGHRGTISQQLEFEVFHTETRGLGLRCRNVIEEGQLILEYTGEVVRASKASKDQVCLDCPDVKVLQQLTRQKRYGIRLKDSGHLITALRNQGFARYINHSCKPNCGAKEFSDSSTSPTTAPRIFIEALRAIEPNEELCMCYAKDFFEKGECECGERECIYK